MPASALRLRVLLAEDHAVVREGTREILAHDARIEVVGEAADGPGTLALAAATRPDLVLLDLSLPGLNGIEVTRRLRALQDPPGVLLLSAYDDIGYVIAATQAGAGGYLLKTAYAAHVIAAIHAVVEGEVVLDPVLARELARRAAGQRTNAAVLTASELEILRLGACGLRNREIARELAMSVRTVEAHLTNVYNKLGVAGRTEAILHAVSRGWLALGPSESPPAASTRGADGHG